MAESRPALNAELTGGELRRWYWLRSELVDLARRLGVSTSGGKADLTERLAAVLDGDEPPPPAPRRPTTTALPTPLTGATVLPRHQRCTQQLREWFVEQVGPGFRFDAPMRAFVGEGGHTLDDALGHWRATRSAPPTEIGAQFELNRFSRQWHRDHPVSSHADMIAAWRAHRARPHER